MITESIIILIALFLFLQRCSRSLRVRCEKKSITIIVLGDVGRSPRMLYHAQSLASNGYRTTIVAYRGSAPPHSLSSSSNVSFVYIPTPLGSFIGALPRPLFLLLSPLKVALGAGMLAYTLLSRVGPSPDFILVQNPPAIPTLPVVQLVAFLRSSRIIIDWHNTGYSVLALRLGRKSFVVALAKRIELYFGKHAHAHLCVTEAMKDDLLKDAQLQGEVVVYHDRPPKHFRPLAQAEKHQLFLRLPFFAAPSLDLDSSPSDLSLSTTITSSTIGSSSSSEGRETTFPLFPPTTSSAELETPFPSTSSSAVRETPFTTATGEARSDRPALLVSATSWTADEDFGLLLRALTLYDQLASSSSSSSSSASSSTTTATTKTTKKKVLPKVVLVVTGKGAGKMTFERQVMLLETNWSFVKVRTAWLTMEDYPLLLGAADLGISLHTSTSGADLPMKVVDLFGCNVPVCALDFACVDELVQQGINGCTFRTAQELADQLATLLGDFPHSSKLDSLRKGISTADYAGEQWCAWEENWEKVVAPLLASSS